MRLLIFILALTSAFFVPTTFSVQLDLDDLRDPKVDVEHIYRCNFSFSWGGGTTSKVPANSISEAYSSCAAWGLTNIDRSQPCGTSSKSSNGRDRIYIPLNQQLSDGTCIQGGLGGGQINITLTDEGTTETESCPPDTSPEHKYDYNIDGVLKCAKAIDPYDNCPAPTDSDLPTFGTGQQTTICYDNPDGTQCKITSDETGFYKLPVSFGSSEPTRCRQRESAPIDQTPEPEIKPAPEETDPEPEPDDLSAINKINENLDAINNNLIEASDSNDDRLDRLAEELQIGNQLLGEIRDNPQAVSIDMGEFESTDNGLLQEIADNTGEMVGLLGDEGDGEGDGEPAPDCIGDICDFDSDQYYADADKEMSDWLNKKEDLKPGQEVESYINKFNGFVGSAFAGFTGSCVAFSLDVSLRGQPKKITVGQHCSYYDQYFKPVLEWFLWVLTFVALLVISSQSFRAFSSI
ncbi:hypothetical protein [Pseudoalteromonas gelatinilytica]|uniref:Uncharacterized protein n=1 Tax=Pseudoalteromonas gelatinilytica TaxID=1703256 RepID=A0ABQ1TPE1_9GAMM|nr:hypothetical protein [Pseudoalteromonas profundi]GGF00541.1 hypothetical protein GCM10008027_26730 [Pseudoalteromonas profundi]